MTDIFYRDFDYSYQIIKSKHPLGKKNEYDFYQKQFYSLRNNITNKDSLLSSLINLVKLLKDENTSIISNSQTPTLTDDFLVRKKSLYYIKNNILFLDISNIYKKEYALFDFHRNIREFFYEVQYSNSPKIKIILSIDSLIRSNCIYEILRYLNIFNYSSPFIKANRDSFYKFDNLNKQQLVCEPSYYHNQLNTSNLIYANSKKYKHFNFQGEIEWIVKGSNKTLCKKLKDFFHNLTKNDLNISVLVKDSVEPIIYFSDSLNLTTPVFDFNLEVSTNEYLFFL